MFGVSTQTSQLTLINRAAETISEARLRQGGRNLAQIAVEPGQIRSTDFISRNGPLTLVVKFASGRSISADDVGYLAGGMPVIVTFQITDNKVALLTIAKPNWSSSGRR